MARRNLGHLDAGAPGSAEYSTQRSVGFRWALNWAREVILRQVGAWRWRAAVLLSAAALAVGQGQGVTRAREWLQVIQAAVPAHGGRGVWPAEDV